MDLSVTPQAFLINPSDINGGYSAYLASDPEIKTVNWFKNEYGGLPATDYGLLDGNLDVCLPPTDNIIQDPGFEGGSIYGVWQGGGDFTPTVTTTLYHTGDYAAFFGTAPTMSPPMYFDNTTNWVTPLVSDEKGNVHFVWILWYTVHYAQRLANGTWLPTEEVFQQNNSNITDARIAVDGNGKVHMLIAVDSNLLYTVRDAGGNWSPPQTIYTNVGPIDMQTYDPNNIYALLGNSSELYYAHLVVGDTWEIEPVPNVVDQRSSIFALGHNAEFHILWSSISQENLYYEVRLPDGTWTNPAEIYGTGFNPEINMVLDSDGNPHILWNSYYTSLKPDGSWTTPYELTEGKGGYGASLVIDRQDTLSAFWANNDGYNGDVFFAQKKQHQDWSEPQIISNTNEPPSAIDAAVSSGGDLFVVWRELIFPGYSVEYTWKHAGVWSTPVMVSDGGDQTVQGTTNVIVNSLGGVSLAWTQGDIPQLYYAGFQPYFETGDSWLSQSFTVPITMTYPTLSFLANLSGVSDASGNEFQALVSSDTFSTTLLSTTDSTNWAHFWFDMTPWSGQEITLTFELTQNSGFPPASALLDEVTLGSAHTDVWVNLSGGDPVASPGDQFSYQLDYGNRSGITADQSVITLTLPIGLNYVDASIPPVIIGDQLVWQLGDLPANSSFEAIHLTLEVGSNAPLFQMVVTSVEITTSSPELELLNNTSQSEIYLGYFQRLPIIQR
jgi:hypothetical protein